MRRQRVDKPTTQSVFLGDKYINLSQIARAQDINQGYLSRIFAGIRIPSLGISMKIAAAIGMGLEDFLEAIAERREIIQQEAKRLQQQHLERVIAEDTEDLKTLQRGRIPKPRLPGTRLPA